MALGRELADRMVERLFGGRRAALPVREKPMPPLSVKARLDDSRKLRAQTTQKLRKLRLF